MLRFSSASRVLCIVALLALVGCGTIVDTFNISDRSSHQLGSPGPHVYGGTRLNVAEIGFYSNADGIAWLLLAVLALDIPLTLALDTLLLPITLISSTVR